MNYESRTENAMILPIPVKQPASENNVRFIDFKDYPNFFDHLVHGFPFTAPFSIACSAPIAPDWRRSLEVVEVGNYIASFVPTHADFSRLDDRFVLPESTWSKIPHYNNYGFAVFQLAAGSLKPHPMAFEFDSACDSIYFPTVHIHDGEIHETEEFDHVLYLQHAGFDSRVHGYRNADLPDHETGLIRSKYAAKLFCDVVMSKGVVVPHLLIHRRFIRGNHLNRDTEIATSGDPTFPNWNLRPLIGYLPGLAVVAAVMWFFRRREKLLRSQSAKGKDADAST